MSDCDKYNPDNVFKRFKVIEFPVSFVGLATEKYLDVETNLARDAYLKTMCDGSLLKFAEAREISASHRAFHLVHVNNNTVKITFKPINECISNPKSQKLLDNKFIFDLRLIHVDGYRCCNNEFHSEIGRYYISGQFEYCNLSHNPKVLNFGEVFMNTEVTKHVRIKNDSSHNACQMESIKVTGFEVQPRKFLIRPNSSIRLKVIFKPTCLAMTNDLFFEVRNPHDWRDSTYEKTEQNNNEEDTNCLPYTISCKLNVKYKNIPKNIVVESLHKLIELDTRYTYVGEKDTNIQKNRKEIAKKHLDVCKSYLIRKPVMERFCTGRDKCYSDISIRPRRLPQNFCKPVIPRINTYAVFDVLFIPNVIEFGRIACNTYGEKPVTIFNNTSFEITITLQVDNCITYTNEKISTLSIKLQAYGKTEVALMCLGYIEGAYEGTFIYQIDNKYSRKHKYSLQVGNPTLRILENCLKFGMVTSDSFITSVPVRIYNDFNIPVKYQWDDIIADVPFDIIPKLGEIPQHSCKICDIIYVCRPTKTKTHEINLNSLGYRTKVIPVELSVMTRKLTVKFLQQSVMFKDVPLNIKTIERVKLENSSREIATFFVVEPLIPGFTVEPMHGNIRPKMVLTFEMIAQIPCVLEFAFDVVVKINNKENVSVSVSGNVVEPKMTIQPKNIYMARIPLGMITYVPITFQNLGSVKTVVELLDTGDENIFDVYTIGYGNEKQRIFEFCLDIGQSKTVFIKVLDIFRREYDMYVPIKVNGLLGPPEFKSGSTELQTYVGPYESQYENNPRVKIKNLSKDIPYCRIYGVITVSWIQLSQENFEIEYVPNGNNTIEFTMKNVSKYFLFVTVLASKLSPAFSLNAQTENSDSIVTDNNIKFEMDRQAEVEFTLKFHPKMNGRFISTAILFLDKQMTIPYYNLTFIGKRLTPTMTPSTYRILFPPCYIGTTLSRLVTAQMEFVANIDEFSSSYKAEPNLIINFLKCEVVQPDIGELYSILTVEISVTCNTEYGQNLILIINHECGSGCEIEIIFLFTQCVLTLHANRLVAPANNPYPYYPLSSQTELYDYMTTCTQFLEKWMFQQGFRRDLYPVIPDTFHAISTFLSSQFVGGKSKGISVTFLNFMKRIAGPMMKHFQKPSSTGVEEAFKGVKEVYETYRQILNILRSRGSDLRMLQAKFLLSYDQFVIYNEFVTPKSNSDNLISRELLGDPELFYRLSKQCWFDLILQCYKVFIVESCFFECVCISNENRDIVKILIDWYNAQIIQQHKKLVRKDVPYKPIQNLTSDLMDGIALASAILTHCPFLAKHFEIFLDSDDKSREALIIHNACLIIEAMNLLRLYFPLTSTDFLEPNFLQMLFLSIHLYVVLPMFKPRDVVQFNPPLLRSSTRNVGVCPTTQESLIFSYILINNNRNSFTVEKVPSAENGKKMFLSAKYTAHFVDEEECVLLLHGYNKTRIFDTYMIFILKGCVGALTPHKKCRVTGPLYRPNKVEVLVPMPFSNPAIFSIHITDKEPTIPVVFECIHKPKFYVRRLNLIDNEISLIPAPKDSGPDSEQKIYLQLMCLSTQLGNSWLWFRSEIGEFFMRITTQPRWDLAVDTLQAKVDHWPVDPCSCGEACECYRTTILSIPHRNELMVKALRYALLEFASDIMLNVFDQLIATQTGKLILCTLFEEGGTNMNDVKHILRSEIKYRITSKTLVPQIDRVVLYHHGSSVFPLPVTLPARDKSEKYSVTFISECGMDIRTYRIIFVQSNYSLSDSSRSPS